MCAFLFLLVGFRDLPSFAFWKSERSKNCVVLGDSLRGAELVILLRFYWGTEKFIYVDCEPGERLCNDREQIPSKKLEAFKRKWARAFGGKLCQIHYAIHVDQSIC